MVRDRHRLRPAEMVFLILCFLLTCGYSVVVSHARPMWSDELFGWMLLTDPSFHHMLASWRAGADGGGIAFYLLGRLWIAVFGRTMIAFRLFSAVGMFFALLLFWLSARRFYRFVPLAGAVTLVWFGPPSMLWHMVQTRFYGLLLAAVALALFALVRSYDSAASGSKSTDRLLWFAAHTLLVASHPLGVAYSGVLLLAAVLIDWSYGRWRLPLYVSGLLGWLVLLPSREALRSSAMVNQPHSWTTRPNLDGLSEVYTLNSNPVGISIVVLLILALAAWRLGAGRPFAHAPDRRALLIPAALLFVLPFAVWEEAQWAQSSLFVDRYLLPLCFGSATLLAEALTPIFRSARPRNGVVPTPVVPIQPVAIPVVAIQTVAIQAVALAIVLLIPVWAMWSYPSHMVVPVPEFQTALLASLPRGEPVAVERADLFDMLRAEAGVRGNSVVYLLDWETAMAPESPRGDVSSFHEMENWRKAGYYSGSILDSDVFLRETPRFAVIDDPKERWFERRIANDPRWVAVPIGSVKEPRWQGTVWQVDRRP